MGNVEPVGSTTGSPLEAVARVLRSHVSSFDEAGQTYQREWADRAAAAVVAALELREETAFKYTHNASGRHTIIESDSSDVRIARKIAGDTHTLAPVRRWVSSWTSGSDQ